MEGIRVQRTQQDAGYIEHFRNLIIVVNEATNFTEDNSLEEIKAMLGRLDTQRHEFLDYGARTNNPEALEDILMLDQVTYALLRLKHGKEK
jgi:hypothetical protein